MRYLRVWLGLIVFAAGMVFAAQAQSEPNPETLPLACRNVQHLMGQTQTAFRNLTADPFAGLHYEGGVLPDSEALTLPAGVLGQVWLLDLRDLPNLAAPIEVTIERSNTELEIALFSGSRSLSAVEGAVYNRIAANERRTLVFAPVGSNVYSLIVRRRDYSTISETSIDYHLQVNAPMRRTATDLRQSLLDTGLRTETLTIPTVIGDAASVDLRVQASSLLQDPIAQPGVASLLFNGDGRLDFQTWVQSVSVVAGDVVLVGEAERRRVLYVENVDLANINSTETSQFLRDGLIDLETDWASVDGLWVLRGCAGALLSDGRSFVAEMPIEGERTLRAEGALDDFALRFNSFAATAPQSVALDLDWSVMAEADDTRYDPNAQVQYLGGAFNLPFRCDREMHLETARLQVTGWDAPIVPASCESNDEALPVALQIGATPQSLQVDWSNLYSLSLGALQAQEQVLSLTFRDEAEIREGLMTTRTIPRLQRFVAQSDIIDIITEPLPDQAEPVAEGVPQRITARHQRLLPAQDGYIELVLADGQPGYDATAFPDERHYQPRALNNTGRECYPVTTMLDEINCAPNGEVNPANGNLWYAITDHQASGEQIDLSLTRSYNSRLAQWDGPFGLGWNAGLRFDYATVAYAEALGTRQVNLADASPAYRAMLDLTWQPAGFIGFLTPSGSQHQFNEETTGFYTAQTMRGWQLLDPTDAIPRYLLWQDDGLTYEFDRAGRLRCYGYPDVTQVNPSADGSANAYPYATCEQPEGVDGRWIRIDYEWETALNGPNERDAPQVILTDAAALRQIELYFDANGHVTRSILRDLTTTDSDAACELGQNCLEILYRYQDGVLIEVVYPDGQLARYAYDDEQSRLCYHNDPRAPQLPAAVYEYADAGGVAAVYASNPTILSRGCDADRRLLWRSFETDIDPAPLRDGEILRVTRTDETGFSRQLDYAHIQAETLRERDDNFVLLADIGFGPDAQSVAEYTWDDGLLRTIGQVSVGEQSVLNSTDLSYSTEGELREVDLSGILNSGTLPGFTVIDELLNSGDTRRTVGFSDLTHLQFVEAASGGLQSQVTRTGAELRYTWEAGQIASIETRSSNAALERTAFNRDAAGLIIAVTRRVPDGEPYTIAYERDGLGRIIVVRDPLVGHYQVIYDHTRVACERGENQACFAARMTIRDPLGAETHYQYDLLGRLVEWRVVQGDALLRCTSYAYQRADADPHFWDELQAITEWNDLGATATQPCGEMTQARRTSYDYSLVQDDAGRQIGTQLIETDALSRETVYQFDLLGRLTRRVQPTGDESRYRYQVDEYEDIQTIAQDRRVQLRVRELRFVADGLERCVDIYFDRARRPVVVDLWYGAGNLPIGADACETNTLETPLRWVLTYREASQSLEAQSETLRAEYLLQVTLENSAVAQSVRYALASDSAPQVSIVQDLAGVGAGTVTSTYRETRDSTGQVTEAQTGATPLDQTTVLICPRSFGRQQVVRFAPNLAPDSLSCNLVVEDDPIVSSVTWYDAHHRVICQRENNQRTHRWHYSIEDGHWLVQEMGDADALCRDWVATTSPPAGRYAQTFAYNTVGDLRHATSIDGTRYRYEVDQFGQLLAIYVDDQETPQVRYRYSSAGLLLRTENSDGSGFTYATDALGNLTQEQALLTQDTVSYIYDGGGRLTDRIGTQGERTTYRRDAELAEGTRYEWLTVTDPVGGVHQYRVDPIALTIDYTDPNNHETRYHFDHMGLLWRIDDAAGRQHQLRYDALGRLRGWQQNDAAQALSLTYLHDLDANGLTITLAEANTPNWQQRYQLTASGQLTGLSYGDSDVLNLRYGPFGRLTDIAAGDAARWALDWQADERQLTIRDAEANLTTWHYDAAQRLLRYAAPDSAILSYTYLPERIVIQQGEAATWVLRQAPLSGTLPPRMILEAGAEQAGQRRAYTYDAAGRVISVLQETCLPDDTQQANASCSVALADRTQLWQTGLNITYNDAGLPISFVAPDQTVESFSYDRAGNLETYQTANRDTFRYGYDALNRLTQLTAPSGLLIFVDYNALDQVVGICQAEDGNNAPQSFAECEQRGTLLERYATDALGRLSYRIPMTPEATEQAFGYAYDEANNTLQAWGVVVAPDSVQSPLNAAELSETVQFGYDALGNPQAVTVDNMRYNLSYDTSGRLRTANGEQAYRYTYDDFGRLAALVIGSQTIDYTYAEDRSGYALQLSDGRQLAVELNQSGLLQALRLVDPAARRDLLRFTYSSAGDELVALILGQQRSALRLDQNGLLNNFLYRGTSFQLSAARDGVGQLQRQNISGSVEFLVGDVAQSLLLTYNNDQLQRPLTTRLTESTGRILYTLINTYDTTTLSTAIRQLPGGSQESIQHRYAVAASGQRLPQRLETTITLSAAQAVSLNVGVFLLVAGFGMRLPKRRWLLIGICVVSVLAIWSVSTDQAQGQAQWAYRYQYDARGNLSELQVSDDAGQRCTVRYRYDQANRLIALTVAGTDNSQRTYNYDAFNRLVAIETGEGLPMQLLYNGAEATPFAVQDADGQLTLFIEGQDRIIGFALGRDDVQQIVYDGDGQVLTTIAAEQATTALNLQDPRLRTIALNEAETLDPCQRVSSSTALDALGSITLIAVDNAVWDARSQLYFFSDGRAYDAILGQFLQPNPSGPSISGGLYGYQAQALEAPIRTWQAPFLNGLQILSEARTAGGTTQALSAEAIWERHVHNADAQSSRLFTAQIDVGRQRLAERLGNWSDVPDFIGRRVAANSADINPRTGAWNTPALPLGVVAPNAISDSASRRSLALAEANLPDSMAYAQTLLNQSSVSRTPFTTYVAEQWRPALIAPVPHVRMPAVDFAEPATVLLDELQQPFSQHQLGETGLALIVALQAAIERDGADWVADYLQDTLPTTPQLPPSDLDTWQAQWFTTDIFRIQSQLEAAWPVPLAPDAPQMPIGDNPIWIEPAAPPLPFVSN